MIKKERFLFIFNFGSEIRQFSHSGVISTLLDDNKEVYISLRVQSDEIIETLDSRVKILPYYRKSVAFYITLLKDVLDNQNILSTTWKYMPKQKVFKNKRNEYIYKVLKKIFEISVKNRWLRYLLTNLELKILFSLYNESWAKLLQDNKITKIIVNVPNYNYTLLATAHKNKIPMLLAFHTNKDLYTLGRISPFYNRIGVWNNDMKDELLKINPHINEEKILIIGCSHFCEFSPKANAPTKIEKKLNLNDDEKLILYIAAAPFVVKNEHLYLKLLEEKLEIIGLEKYTIVVKINPMDKTKYWPSYISSKVKIVNSEWEWNEKEAFNYPKKSDIENFIYLLTRSTVCIGLPSTVVVEASLMQVPFLNICFNYKNIETIYKKVSDMWNAPFYKSVIETNAAIGTFNPLEFENKLKELLINNENILTGQKKFIRKELTFQGYEIKDKSVHFIGEYNE
ncbi:MAG: hypothetical protein COA44_00620 [Arcobacter sp.]|nr:MAG: hypothetical protein COA44_00620 [Arcobacter sp.]